MRRKCDECDGNGQLLEGIVNGDRQYYQTDLNPVVAWPSSSVEWREEFVSHLTLVNCPVCSGSGDIDDE